ncbi:hypothetical protein S4A8_18643 [Salinisphaera sp. S4-8]
MARQILTDEHWSKLKRVLLAESIYDKSDLRLTVEGMLYRMRTGCPWRDRAGTRGLQCRQQSVQGSAGHVARVRRGPLAGMLLQRLSGRSGDVAAHAAAGQGHVDLHGRVGLDARQAQVRRLCLGQGRPAHVCPGDGP